MSQRVCDIFTVTYRDELLFPLALYNTFLNFYLPTTLLACNWIDEVTRSLVSSTTPFTSLTKFAHSSFPPVHVKIYSSFRLSGIPAREMFSSAYVRVEERRFLASCRELRRRAEATAEEAATTSGYFSWRLLLRCGDYVCPLICAETRQRGPLSVPSRWCSEWVSGSSGLGPTRYVLSFITMFHAHFSSCSRPYTRCRFYSPIRCECFNCSFNFLDEFYYTQYARRANRESFSMVLSFFFPNSLQRQTFCQVL